MIVRNRLGAQLLMCAVRRLEMTTPTVRPVRPTDAARWLELRCELWPGGRGEELHNDIAAFFAGTAREPIAVLVAERDTHLIGFVELSIRACAEGCITNHVAFLEGWYVVPAERRTGVGRALVRAAECWGRDAGCVEFASDAQPSNFDSIGAHMAVGFENAGMVVCFRKSL